MVLFSKRIKVHSFVGHNLFKPLERLEHLDVKKTTATGVCDCPHGHCPKHLTCRPRSLFNMSLQTLRGSGEGQLSVILCVI